MHDLEYIIYLKIPDLTATTKLLGGGGLELELTSGDAPERTSSEEYNLSHITLKVLQTTYLTVSIALPL